MTIRVAINGFGRIGRMVYRRALEVGGIDVVAVNGTSSVESLAHLLKYDSVHGTWNEQIQIAEDGWFVRDRFTRVFGTRYPEELPWGDLDVDVVVESTGCFRTRKSAGVHLENGARKVVISAPAQTEKDADITVVMGVNHQEYNPALHHIISGASCTTNCLAPTVKVLHEAFGIRTAMVTTIHSYTNDQRNLDNPHKDLRRARASGESIIPTTTGAMKAIGLVIPDLKGKFTGLSVRVPTPNVSLIDLVAEMKCNVSAEEVNETLAFAAVNSMAGILGYTEKPLVSVDFNGDSRSSVIDGLSTMVMEGHTLKVLAWYDNEWGYSCRMIDLVRHVAQPMTDAVLHPESAHPGSVIEPENFVPAEKR